MPWNAHAARAQSAFPSSSGPLRRRRRFLVPKSVASTGGARRRSVHAKAADGERERASERRAQTWAQKVNHRHGFYPRRWLHNVSNLYAWNTGLAGVIWAIEIVEKCCHLTLMLLSPGQHSCTQSEMPRAIFRSICGRTDAEKEGRGLTSKSRRRYCGRSQSNDRRVQPPPL